VGFSPLDPFYIQSARQLFRFGLVDRSSWCLCRICNRSFAARTANRARQELRRFTTGGFGEPGRAGSCSRSPTARSCTRGRRCISRRLQSQRWLDFDSAFGLNSRLSARYESLDWTFADRLNTWRAILRRGGLGLSRACAWFGMPVIALRPLWPFRALEPIAAINSLWPVAAFWAVTVNAFRTVKALRPVWTILAATILPTIRRAVRIIATALFVEAVATRTLLRAILGRPILALLRPTLRPVIKVALWTIQGTILLRAIIPVRAVFTRPAVIPHRAITIAIAVAVPIAITAFARGELAITVAAILVTAIRPSIRTWLALRAGCSCATGLIKARLRFLATDLAAGVGLLLVIII
jgi:hypothetical protein